MTKPEDEVFLLPSEDEGTEDEDYKPKNGTRRLISYLLPSIVIFSCTLNIFQTIWMTFGKTLSCPESRTISSHEYARMVDVPLCPKSVYESAENSIATEQLINAFNPDMGLVALPKNQNFLPSEQFPWDSSKEVYVTAGYHSLHSLQVIWKELLKLSGDKPITSHIIHSINVLWGDTLCAASTTPLSIAHKYISNRTAIDEVRQTRQCRDWKAVEEFRAKNTACFKDLGAARHHTPMIEEWTFCPEDSPYKKVVDEYLAHAGNKDK